jgi:hypothetical protein
MAGNPLPIQPNVPPPTPLQSMNAAKQDIAPPIEDGSTKLQENPLFDKRQMRFINDSLEIVK